MRVVVPPSSICGGLKLRPSSTGGVRSESPSPEGEGERDGAAVGDGWGSGVGVVVAGGVVVVPTGVVGRTPKAGMPTPPGVAVAGPFAPADFVEDGVPPDESEPAYPAVPLPGADFSGSYFRQPGSAPLPALAGMTAWPEVLGDCDACAGAAEPGAPAGPPSAWAARPCSPDTGSFAPWAAWASPALRAAAPGTER